MELAFVQPDMGASAHVRVEHPIDDEERALDATDFAKRRGEIMPALGKNVASWHPMSSLLNITSAGTKRAGQARIALPRRFKAQLQPRGLTGACSR